MYEATMGFLFLVILVGRAIIIRETASGFIFCLGVYPTVVAGWLMTFGMEFLLSQLFSTALSATWWQEHVHTDQTLCLEIM